MSAGMNRKTGYRLSGWDHVLQSLTDILTTMVGTRVMRRTYGSMVPALLGRPINRTTVLRFATAIVVAIELWEPRFRVKRITFRRSQNSPEQTRLGSLSMVMVGEYRPRGHLGDPTPEAQDRTLTI